MSSSDMRFVKEFTRPDFLAKTHGRNKSHLNKSLFLFYERLENDLRGFWMTPYLENYVQRQTESSARECALHLKVFEEITCLAFITLPPIINQRLCPWGSNPKTDHALQADSQWDSGALCTEGLYQIGRKGSNIYIFQRHVRILNYLSNNYTYKNGEMISQWPLQCVVFKWPPSYAPVVPYGPQCGHKVVTTYSPWYPSPQCKCWVWNPPTQVSKSQKYFFLTSWLNHFKWAT